MDKLLVLTLMAAAMANAALGAEIWLNPTNVAVNCEGRVASLRQVGAKWSGEGIEVELAADGRISLRAPEKAVSAIDVMYDLSYPHDAGVRIYRDGWERTYGDAGWYPVTSRGREHPW